MVVDGAVPPQLTEIIITTMLRNAYCYPALLPGTGEEMLKMLNHSRGSSSFSCSWIHRVAFLLLAELCRPPASVLAISNSSTQSHTINILQLQTESLLAVDTHVTLVSLLVRQES